MRRKSSWGVLLGLAAFSPVVMALGIAEPQLRSSLNEPLHATLTLTDTQGLDSSQLHVGLASESAYDRAGVQRTALIESLHLQVEKASGGLQLVMTSPHPIREPFLDLLLVLEWPHGQLQRQVTLLFDPAGYQSAPALVGGQAGAADAVPVPAQATPQGKPMPERRQAERRVEIRPGDTLWNVASRVRPSPDINLRQVMLALYEANPGAFPGNNMNSLRAGAVLEVPSLSVMQAEDAQQAAEKIRSQYQQWLAGSGGDDATVTSGSHASEPEPDEGTMVSTEVASGASNGEARPRLTLLSDDWQGSGEGEDGELAKRLHELEAAWETRRTEFEEMVQQREQLSAEVEGLREQIAALREALDDRETPGAEGRIVPAATDAVAMAGAPSAVAATQAAVPDVASRPDGPRDAARFRWQNALEQWQWLAAGLAGLLLGLLLWRRRQRQEESAAAPSEPAAAIAVSEQARPASPDETLTATAISEADIYIAYRRYPQAREWLQERLEASPGNEALRLKLLTVLGELGDVSGVEREGRRLRESTRADIRQEALRLCQHYATHAASRDRHEDTPSSSKGTLRGGKNAAAPAHASARVMSDTIVSGSDGLDVATAWRHDDAPLEVPSGRGEAPSLEIVGNEASETPPEPRTPEAQLSLADAEAELPRNPEMKAGEAASERPFVAYEPPTLNTPAVQNEQDGALQQPSIDYELPEVGTEPAPSAPATPASGFSEQEWEIEEVAFEALHLDNEPSFKRGAR
ncbi:hypothetical protein GCM10027040_08080 [Halomonas shantousis]